MTSTRGAAALIGGISLLERAINYTLGSLHMISSAALSHPTPCSDWDLRTLLEHLDDSFAALQEAVEVGQVDLVVPMAAKARNSDPVAVVRERATRLLGIWARADGGPATVSIGGSPLTTSIVGGTGAVEVAVHGWDVARACGRNHPIPASLAEEMLDFSPLLVTDADRPIRFAAPIPLSYPASPSDRLVAFLGRQPG